jgi:hypothetical protein
MKKLSLVILVVLFLILPALAATIQVTAPAAGAAWKIGSNQTVQWTFNDIPTSAKVHVILWRNGTNLGKIAEQLDIGANGLGSFNWNVGVILNSPAAVAGSGYSIRVRRMDNTAMGESGIFSLTSGGMSTGPQVSQLESNYELVKKAKPVLPEVSAALAKMIQVSEPKAGAVLLPTGSADILWKFVNIPAANVSVSLRRNGQPDVVLTANHASPGTFHWDLNAINPDPGTCKIVVETLDKAHRGLSGAFAIKELGQIEPLFPFQDLSIYDDTSLDVKWKRVGNIQKVTLVLKKTNNNWQKILATDVDAKLEKKNVTFNFDQYGQFMIEFNYNVDGENVNVASGVFTIQDHD